VQRFVEQQQVSLKWITQGLSNSGRKRSKVSDGGAVMMMPESLIAFVDEVNGRPVGKPQEQGLMNIAASFSLSKKPRLSIQ
jgi:hypothetical protein